MHEAVRRLVDQEILDRVQIERREKKRYQFFYEKEVDLLFRANEQQLEHFFKKFADSEGKYIPMYRVINDILGAILKIGSAKAQVLYGRSKMSVANETGSNIEAYRQLQYVELLELLCRATYYVSKRVPPNNEQLPFIKHLELILD